MVTQFYYDDEIHFDDETLRKLLTDELVDRRLGEVTAHLETCPDCQTKLERISETGISMQDVRQYLRPDEPGDCVPSGDIDQHERPRRLDFLTESDDPQSIGRFGRYEVREILGHGGMGIVMRGYDPALSRHSAIKVLAPHLATSAAARSRFFREAKSAAAVVHEHVIPIHTVDEEQGIPYLIMPVVEGRSLEQRVQEQGPLKIQEVLRIGMQIASGLAAAHGQGLVHRDVKPANILLAGGIERVMITDFGLARAADDANMTQSGVIAGTPQYMSPEQARGNDLDHRSDLFSLGSLLYFMCAGRSPFRSETTMGVLHRIVNDRPRSLASVNPDVPSWLQSIIERLLAKDASERFQSAAEVSDLLGRWLAHLQQPLQVSPPEKIPSEQPQPTRRGSSSHRRLIGVVIGFFLLISAGVAVVLEMRKGTLVIESWADAKVVVRRADDGQIAIHLTVLGGSHAKTRIAAGQYIIEVDGQHDGLQIDQEMVTLRRGGSRLVRITQRDNSDAGEKAARFNAPDGESHASDVQLHFKGPPGLKIHILDQATAARVPSRHTVPAGWSSKLRFDGVTAFPGKQFFATAEVYPSGGRTQTYVSLNAIPITLTVDDFDQAQAGNLVTKVIYLPDPAFQQTQLAGVQTIVSTRIDPGQDPVLEADRRGTILAIIRLRSAEEVSPLAELSTAVTPLGTGATDAGTRRSVAALQTLYGLLPADAQAMLATPDAPRLGDNWRGTELSRLASHPALRPLLSRGWQALLSRTPAGNVVFGFEQDQWVKLLSGRIVLAWLPSSRGGRPGLSVACIADVSGEDYQAAITQFDRLANAHTARRDHSGVEIRQLIVASGEGLIDGESRPGVVFVAHAQGLLLASDDVDALKAMIDRLNHGGSEGSLQHDPALVRGRRELLNATEEAEAQTECDIQFFVRPLRLAERLQGTGNRGGKKSSGDILSAFRQTGFESVPGVYGEIALGELGLTHRTFVLADRPLPSAAGILDFPNRILMEPPKFVSETTAAVTALHWNVQEAFSRSANFFDELAGTRGVFEDVLQGIKFDPNGPRIDVAGELLPLFTGDMYVLAECSQVDRDHRLLVFKVHDLEAIKDVFNRAFRKEPSARRADSGTDWIWHGKASEQTRGSRAPWLKTWTLAGVDDYLLLSTNLDIMQNTISKAKLATESPLILDSEYQRVAAELLKRFGAEPRCAWQIQTGRAYRAAYELIRTGEPSDRNSLLSAALEWLRKRGASPIAAAVDLPHYQEISEHLPPSGFVINTTDAGWHIQGIVLDTQH